MCPDIVEEVLVQQAADSTNKLNDNITVVSNYIKWDDVGNMEGIKGDVLHSSNKGAFAASLDYKDSVLVQRFTPFVFFKLEIHAQIRTAKQFVIKNDTSALF